MKRGRSTGAPTKAEAARIVACKSGTCVACEIRKTQPGVPLGFFVHAGGDYHHLLSGGIRRGHMFGVCLCPWHHRAVIGWGCTHKEMRDYYGPSLAEGSKPFHAEFGSDQDLLNRQDAILGSTQEQAA